MSWWATGSVFRRSWWTSATVHSSGGINTAANFGYFHHRGRNLARNFRATPLKLSGEEKKKLAKRHTANTEAYELYLKGRYHWSKRTTDGLKKAIEFIDQAIASDPNYALACAGLSDCYNLASAYGIMPPGDSVPRAQQAAQQALRLEPLLPEGHEALAHAKMLFDWDWAGTETGFTKAIELNPNFATAHQRYAIFWPRLAG